MLFAWAVACAYPASAASYSAWEIISSASILALRSRTVFARFALATAPGSWASSALVSWRISRSPFFTPAPDSKAISTIFPVSSAATVTPWTAVREPTAGRAVSHDSAVAAAVVTVSGGGTNFFPCSTIAPICRALTADSAATRITRPTMTSRTRFFKVGCLRYMDLSIPLRCRGEAAFRSAVPPPAAQRLEQRGGVGVPRRLRLDQEDPRQKVLALRVEQREVARGAVAELLLRQVEAVARGGFGLCLRLERHGVGFQRLQHVGHFPERLQDRFTILRRRLVEAGDCGAPLRCKGPAAEDGLHQPGREAPDGSAGPEQVADLRRPRPVPPGKRDLRVQIGRGHPDRGARSVQQLLRGPDVGTLAHQRRRQGYGQIPRQLQPFQFEFGKIRRVPGEPARQDRQQVTSLYEPLLQHGHEHPGLGHLRALGGHLDARRPTEPELAIDERELLFLRRQ